MTRDSGEEDVGGSGDSRINEKLYGIIAHNVTGTVKWFSVKSGYGFITRNDTKEDIFVHQTSILNNNPGKAVPTTMPWAIQSLVDGEMVEFDVVIDRNRNTVRADNVKALDSVPIEGTSWSSDETLSKSKKNDVEIITHRVTGTVKWFKDKSRYGFITRDDTKEDLFVHQTAILNKNPEKAFKSLVRGEIVEFDVVMDRNENMPRAVNVKGLDGVPIKGTSCSSVRTSSKSKKNDVNEIIAHGVTGTVRWFKSRYGYITRDDTKEDLFVHQTAILNNNPEKAFQSLVDGQIVEFDIVIDRNKNMLYADKVKGMDSVPIKGTSCSSVIKNVRV